MIEPGRIAMNEAESAAVEKLADEHDGESLTLTRRDPDETGPLLVHIGEESWELADDGKRRKVA